MYFWIQHFFLHKTWKFHPSTTFHFWDILFSWTTVIHQKTHYLAFWIFTALHATFNFSNFDKMFGITDISEHDNCINFLFLCMKFYLHRCKCQQTSPNFNAFLNLVKIIRDCEYKIAESKGKLKYHFRKWTLDIGAP